MAREKVDLIEVDNYTYCSMISAFFTCYLDVTEALQDHVDTDGKTDV
jgi:hypothetical protein